jgi:hypothetical protein
MTFPSISDLQNISREQYKFIWEKYIEFPIPFKDLPKDSILFLKFYAWAFEIPRVLWVNRLLNCLTKCT